nr:fimbrial assembly protein FimA [Nocardioidaceae bacterium]
LLPLEGELATEVSAHLDHLGFPDLDTWAGVENYELRLVDGRIDRFVLTKLREQSARQRR